jgi:hypothetical protein
MLEIKSDINLLYKDLLIFTFKFLDTKSLVAATQVCKKWESIIKNDQGFKKLMGHSKFKKELISIPDIGPLFPDTTDKEKQEYESSFKNIKINLIDILSQDLDLDHLGRLLVNLAEPLNKIVEKNGDYDSIKDCVLKLNWITDYPIRIQDNVNAIVASINPISKKLKSNLRNATLSSEKTFISNVAFLFNNRICLLKSHSENTEGDYKFEDQSNRINTLNHQVARVERERIKITWNYLLIIPLFSFVIIPFLHSSNSKTVNITAVDKTLATISFAAMVLLWFSCYRQSHNYHKNMEKTFKDFSATIGSPNSSSFFQNNSDNSSQSLVIEIKENSTGKAEEGGETTPLLMVKR